MSLSDCNMTDPDCVIYGHCRGHQRTGVLSGTDYIKAEPVQLPKEFDISKLETTGSSGDPIPNQTMKCVILESPYSGDVVKHEDYALKCMEDSIKRGEAPFASHLIYTQVLDDTDLFERGVGMSAHHAWQAKADAMVVYRDYGISKGMEEAIGLARLSGLPVVYRRIINNSNNKDGNKING